MLYAGFFLKNSDWRATATVCAQADSLADAIVGARRFSAIAVGMAPSALSQLCDEAVPAVVSSGHRRGALAG